MRAFKIISGIVVISVILLIIILFVSQKKVDINQFCTIETKSGKIRGKLNQTLFENTNFYSFRGVPFAKPPINTRRFKVNKHLILC